MNHPQPAFKRFRPKNQRKKRLPKQDRPQCCLCGKKQPGVFVLHLGHMCWECWR